MVHSTSNLTARYNFADRSGGSFGTVLFSFTRTPRRHVLARARGACRLSAGQNARAKVAREIWWIDRSDPRAEFRDPEAGVASDRVRDRG